MAKRKRVAKPVLPILIYLIPLCFDQGQIHNGRIQNARITFSPKFLPRIRLAPWGGFWYSNRVLKLNDNIGEATSYDKKLMLERKDPTSWLKSVSAFANTQGGKLLFGVANDGSLVGLADAQDDSEFISETIKMQMDPVPEIDLSLHEEDGRQFVVVEIKSGSETPYYTFVKGHRDAYIRIGNESVRADAIQLKRLVLKGSGRSWDSLATSYSRTHYSFEVLRASYFAKTKKTFAESDFESFGLADGIGNLTNAGALLADGSPVRHSRVFCTRWRGLTKANGVMEAVDDHEYSGGLISLLNAAKSFVVANSKIMWRKQPGGRIEYPEYPERAYEEGIVNGLIHRDYLEVGSEVHIDIFDDRMEIFSPGAMPSGDMAENAGLRRIASLRRNPVIADLFQRLDFMERRGSGFGKILDAYEFESEKRNHEFKPLFSSSRMGFTLTLPNLNYGVSINGLRLIDNGNLLDTVQGESTLKNTLKSTLKKTDRTLIKIITQMPSATIAEMQDQLGITRDGVNKAVKRLKAAGVIRRVGPDNGGHWEVVK